MHAAHPTDSICHRDTYSGAWNTCRGGGQDLGCCPVSHRVARHQVGLRMERQLPEGELRLRRCMALGVRLQRLHDVHRILQPPAPEVVKLSEGGLCQQIAMAPEERRQSLCNLCRACRQGPLPGAMEAVMCHPWQAAACAHSCSFGLYILCQPLRRKAKSAAILRAGTRAWSGTRRQETLAVALEGTIVLMPVPVKPPQIPTTSRVGRSHLQEVQRAARASCEDGNAIALCCLLPS